MYLGLSQQEQAGAGLVRLWRQSPAQTLLRITACMLLVPLDSTESAQGMAVCGASRSGNRSGSSTPSASMQGQAMVYSTATTHLYSSPWLPCKVRLWLRHKERIPLQASSQISCTAQSSHRYRDADVVHSSSRTMILSVTSVTRHACRPAGTATSKATPSFLPSASRLPTHLCCAGPLCALPAPDQGAHRQFDHLLSRLGAPADTHRAAAAGL